MSVVERIRNHRVVCPDYLHFYNPDTPTALIEYRFLICYKQFAPTETYGSYVSTKGNRKGCPYKYINFFTIIRWSLWDFC